MDEMRYLILGASSDVGMEYVEHLIESGVSACIACQYRTMSEKMEELVRKAEGSNISLKMFKADLTNETDVDNLIKMVADEMECPDRILHLPASKLHYRKIKDASWEDLREDFEIQVVAAGKVLSAFLPKMAKKKYGRVIMMLSSVVCDNPPKFMTEYAIVKNALWGFVKSAAAEYGDKNVSVSGISPEMMETKLLTEVDEKIIALNAERNSDGMNYTVDELIPYIDRVFNEESDCYNGVNIYPEK